ncbi:putative mitochondrial precursor protein import receptor tom70 [Jaminaea rosea]|uniref:Putative mitochondrial protein import receptor tom70 n=1 Tax=Jaminaea rosea TaxID=1569628 RepID=A0A316V0D4_9BASI|nr:putative mitochondrial precursor protein import receptor tom70 [Jaminaea rosea]PWN31010.1 putative mitochondrial precursor protein import receptor tom70 [Jaminaea rosea]
MASTTTNNSAQQAVDAASTQAHTTANRLSRWIDENRNLAIALGVGSAVVAGGGAYYLLSGSSSSSSKKSSKGKSAPDGADAAEKGKAGGSDDAAESGSKGTGAAAASSKSKKKKKSKKGGAGGGGGSSGDDALKRPDGPLLEEASDEALFKLSADEIAKLPSERKESLAQALKAAGNKAYQERRFEPAIDLYTKAIAAQPLAVFFSNRAACYSNLSKYREVIKDCDSALAMDPAYIKALNRRAVAQEHLGADADGEKPGAELDEKKDLLFRSLCDFTAVALLGHFSDQTATESVERVLKKVSTVKAKELLKTREPKLPSPTFVTAYLEAFRKKPHPTLPDSPSQGDQTLLLAFQALDARNYPHACSLFNEAVDQSPSTDELKALAYNMRGTFRFLIGTAPGALEDLNQATELQPSHVQSWVKKASVHMELGENEAAFSDFDKAIAANPDDPDIYYHRGQVYFILGQFKEAMADYEKSTKLDDTFIFSQVQHAVAQYKLENVGGSLASFRRILRNFEGSSEAYNYYGELLLDQGKHEEAMEKFDKAIEIESQRDSSRNVLPMINKALALFQWKQDIASAERLCREALKIDEDCDAAVGTLAQFSLQSGKLQEAIDFFERSANIARTEGELLNAFSYASASRAQLNFIEKFPAQGAQLSAMAGAMG